MPQPVVPAVMHDKAPSKRGTYDDTTQEEAYPLIRHIQEEEPLLKMNHWYEGGYCIHLIKSNWAGLFKARLS